jgi:hypothetical protein
MKKPRKLSITTAHHDNSRHPLMNRQPAADERLAHSRQCPRAADDDAEEMVTVETDSIVGWYLDVLLLNLVKVPDPLIELTVKDDRSEAMFMLHLVLFLLASGLAEEKLSSSHGTLQYVATKKLLRRSGWLVAGKEPDKRTDQYMCRLTRNALRFLQGRASQQG